MNAPDLSRMLTGKQCARALGISVRTLNRLRTSGLITSYLLIRSHRYDLEEVKAALAVRGKSRSRIGLLDD